MSQLCKDKISCPNCQTEGEFDYWSSVNVDLDPELKKKSSMRRFLYGHVPNAVPKCSFPLERYTTT